MVDRALLPTTPPGAGEPQAAAVQKPPPMLPKASTFAAPKPVLSGQPMKPKATNPGQALAQGPAWEIPVPNYDVSSLANDYDKLKRIRVQFDTNVLIPIDDFYWQRAPDTPFIEVQDPDGANLVQQVVATTITTNVDKLLDYAGKEANHYFRADDNPGASSAACALAGRYVTHCWEYNRKRQPGLLDQRRITQLVALRGMTFIELEWLDVATAQEQNGGFPIRMTLHDYAHTAFEFGPSNELRRVIFGKKRAASELDPEWLAQIGNPPEDSDIDVFIHYDPLNTAVIAAGQIVKPLTPHGYHIDGAPTIPVVPFVHAPALMTVGDVAWAPSGPGIRETLIGVAPCVKLLPTAQYVSFIETAQRMAYTDLAIPWTVVHGNVARYPAERLYRAPDDKSTVTVLQAAEALAPGMDLLKYYTDKMSELGISDSMTQGSAPAGTSGQAMAQGNQLSRAEMDAVVQTVQQGMALVDEHLIQMLRHNTSPSTAQLMTKRFGIAPDPAHAGTDPYTNGVNLPLAEQFTGDASVAFNALSVENVRTAAVLIKAREQLPIMDRYRIGLQIYGMKDPQTGAFPIPETEILELLEYDNPLEMISRKKMEALLARDDNPFGKLNTVLAYLDEAGGMLDAQTLSGLREQWRQAYLSVLQTQLTSDLHAAQQMAQQGPGGGAPPGGAPAPTGPPPAGGTPPPGGAPAGAPMPPGPPQPPLRPAGMANPIAPMAAPPAPAPALPGATPPGPPNRPPMLPGLGPLNPPSGAVPGMGGAALPLPGMGTPPAAMPAGLR